jgi:hypothetical protein
MKKIYCLFLILNSILVIAQTDFDKGFKTGFKEGFCFDKGIACIAPIPPLTPLLRVNENLNSYTDGYNRGFQIGLEAQKKRETKSTSNKISSERTQYQTSDSKFVQDKMSTIPVDFYMKVLELNERKMESTYSDREKIFEESLKKAQKSFEQKDYASSINYSKTALSTNFENDYIYLLMGSSYFFIEDYGPSLLNLKKAKQMGNRSANEIINKIKLKKSQMEYIKPLAVGFTIGSNFNNEKKSILVGTFLEANISKKHSFIAEAMFYKDETKLTPKQSRFNSISENETRFEDENVFQVNLLLKYRFSKRFHFKYGVGGSVSTTYDLGSLDFVGGLQYNITSHFFTDLRVNQQIYNFTDKSVFDVENMENIERSTLNFQLSLGYKF